MKKFSAFLLALTMILASIPVLAETVGNEEYTVKTGVSYDDPWGITVANVIYKGDEVFKILIDTVRPNGGLSSKEHFDEYGIKVMSSLDKEWWEEVVFFQNWAEQNDLSTLQLDETGHAVNADVISGATINLTYYVDALNNADAGITTIGEYTVKTGFSYSEPWGPTIANVIYKGDEVFKVLLDTVRPAGGLSSKEHFDEYCIKVMSSLDKEWWEEAVFFQT